jgi:hypothetical protein
MKTSSLSLLFSLFVVCIATSTAKDIFRPLTNIINWGLAPWLKPNSNVSNEQFLSQINLMGTKLAENLNQLYDTLDTKIDDEINRLESKSTKEINLVNQALNSYMKKNDLFLQTVLNSVVNALKTNNNNQQTNHENFVGLRRTK